MENEEGIEKERRKCYLKRILAKSDGSHPPMKRAKNSHNEVHVDNLPKEVSKQVEGRARTEDEAQVPNEQTSHFEDDASKTDEVQVPNEQTSHPEDDASKTNEGSVQYEGEEEFSSGESLSQSEEDESSSSGEEIVDSEDEDSEEEEESSSDVTEVDLGISSGYVGDFGGYVDGSDVSGVDVGGGPHGDVDFGVGSEDVGDAPHVAHRNSLGNSLRQCSSCACEKCNLQIKTMHNELKAIKASIVELKDTMHAGFEAVNASLEELKNKEHPKRIVYPSRILPNPWTAGRNKRKKIPRK